MTPDSTVPSDTDRLAEAPRPIRFDTERGEVLVEDSWFKVADLPEILGNYMRSVEEHHRQCKELSVKLAKERNENEQLQGRLDTAEGQLAKWREIHKPERRYTPDDGETSYATCSEAADASFDGTGTARSVTFFEICSHCASLEMAEGCEHDYRESLWPCKDAEAAGLGEGDGQ